MLAGLTASNRRLPAPLLTALRPKRPLSGQMVLAGTLRSRLIWNRERSSRGRFGIPGMLSEMNPKQMLDQDR